MLTSAINWLYASELLYRAAGITMMGCSVMVPPCPRYTFGVGVSYRYTGGVGESYHIDRHMLAPLGVMDICPHSPYQYRNTPSICPYVGVHAAIMYHLERTM